MYSIQFYILFHYSYKRKSHINSYLQFTWTSYRLLTLGGTPFEALPIAKLVDIVQI